MYQFDFDTDQENYENIEDEDENNDHSYTPNKSGLEDYRQHKDVSDDPPTILDAESQQPKTKIRLLKTSTPFFNFCCFGCCCIIGMIDADDADAAGG
jgi:hypothetical protein